MIPLNKKSISEQLVEYFKERIEKGILKPGDEFPSERTLEKELGISRKTISKVITVLSSMGYLFKEQGKTTYVTDSYQTRTALPMGKSLGVLFPTPESVYHPSEAPLFMELCRIIQDSPYSIELIFDKSKELRHLTKQVQEKRISGLFIFDYNSIDASVVSNLAIPMVVFGSEPIRLPHNKPFSFIASDAQKAICSATEYLVSQGRRRIAFINGNEKWEIDKRRRRNFNKILAQAGLKRIRDFVGDSHYERRRTLATLEQILKGKPDAIIGADDMIARWVVDELCARGINIPQQIAVVGFNDMQLYSLQDGIQLTTFKLPAREMAEAAVKEIFRRVESPDAKPSDFIFEMKLCQRGSA